MNEQKLTNEEILKAVSEIMHMKDPVKYLMKYADKNNIKREAILGMYHGLTIAECIADKERESSSSSID